jgi:hypothetical protein
MKISPLINTAAPQTTPQLTPHRTIKMKTVSGTSEYVPAPTPKAAEAEAGLDTKDVSVESQKTEEATPVANVSLTPQYAKLVREQKALREQQQALKAERESWEKQRDSDYIPKQKLQENALAALAEAGISSEQLLQLQLDAPSAQDTQAAQLQAKIDALEAKLNGFDESQKQKVSQDYQQAVAVIRQDVTQLVENDPAYETIKVEGEVESVVQLIERVFQTEGKILSPEEAAKSVEEKLLERTVDKFKKLSQLKKLKERIEPSAPVDATASAAGKTLTNKMGSGRPLSARERAILAFNNQLKS